MQTRQWSLARRQHVFLLAFLTIGALALGAAGAWFIEDFAERTSDRVLRASVNAISETIALEKGRVTLEVPPGAFGMLEDSARDNVFYSVRSGTQSITGYDDFPSAQPPPADATNYRYLFYRGQRVRVATQARYLTDDHPPVVVQVAETLDERSALVRRMLLGLIVLEAIFVGLAAALIAPAVRWGIMPITRLQHAIADRRGSEFGFAPLEVSQAPAELRGLIETFNTLLARLDSATRRVREFTADASHQMRTPLAALRAHLHLAADDPGADAASSLAKADIAAVRLQRLLDQLLILARSEGTAERDITTNVAAVCQEVALEAASLAAARDIDLHLEAEKNIEASVDPVLLTELVTNLIDNAIAYNRPKGTVVVRAYRVGDAPVIEVEDDGPGIPPQDRERVFNRFVRLSRDQNAGGSGLGLAIVRSLADIAGARVALMDGSGNSGLLVRVIFSAPRSSKARKAHESQAA